MTEPYYQGNLKTIYNKDCRSMDELEDEYVQMVCTSPPYWGLRKYSGEQDLIWGDNHCEHQWGDIIPNPSAKSGKHGPASVIGAKEAQHKIRQEGNQGRFCSLCGAWKGAFGLEPTPEMYIAHSIEILREIRRVLRKDGVVFWNIGDSYGSGKGTCFNPGGGKGSFSTHGDRKDAGAYPLDRGNISMLKASGLKPKDLCLIPFHMAIEAQKPYQQFTIKELADRAWLAGIVDGEGTIGIHHYERENRGDHYHQFQPFLAVGSSDLIMVERCAHITGFGGSRQKVEAGFQDNRKVITRRAHYEWRLEGADAIRIIEDIFPYLVLKERQARIVYELYNCHAPHSGKGHRVPEEITKKKLELWQLCKACNQRRDVTVNLPPVPQHIEPGWWVRSIIIWSKKNPMPESVTDRPTESHEYILMLTKSGSIQYWTHRDGGGTRTQPKPDYRWVKRDRFIRGLKTKDVQELGNQEQHHGQDIEPEFDTIIEERDTPPEGWTPKNKMGWDRINLWSGHDYYWDADAVREPQSEGTFERYGKGNGKIPHRNKLGGSARSNESFLSATPDAILPNGRNIRSVWEFSTQSYPEAHFAVFPEKLPEICIKAATPEVGCCSKCGAPWVRIIEKGLTAHDGKTKSKSDPRNKSNNGAYGRLAQLRQAARERGGEYVNETKTLGWQPSCNCNADKVPSVVLDPFMGSGTTLLVATKMGRKAIGYDISEQYCELALERNRQTAMNLGME